MRYFKMSAATAAAALALLSTAAQASDGMITFNGSLVSNTCVINSGTSTMTVTLPTLSATSLSAASPAAGATPFSISVANCPSGLSSFVTYFEGAGSANVDQTTGRLKNTATTGAATGVQLRLSNVGGGTAIDLSKPSATQGSAAAALTGTTTLSGTANYVVEYYGTSASAGAVSSSITYSVIYN